MVLISRLLVKRQTDDPLLTGRKSNNIGIKSAGIALLKAVFVDKLAS